MNIRNRFPFLSPGRQIISLIIALSQLLSAQNTVATGQTVTAGFNQDFLVENLTIGNGLSDNWINDVFQDSKGFLWIATEDGLNKYDGYRFTIFKHQPGDTASISHNAVRSILEDQNGFFWFGTRNGLNRFDPLTESFTHFRHDQENPNSLSHNEVLALYEDREGVLWAGALNGLNRFDPQNRQFHLYQHQYPVEEGFGTIQNEIRAITQIPDGRLLIGYWGLGLMLFDKKNESFQPIPVPRHPQPFCINFIEKSPRDSSWIANELIFNQNRPKSASLFLSEFLEGVRFNSAFFNRSGNLLIGTFAEGVYVLDKNYQLKQKFKPEPSGATDPLHNWVRVIFEDQAGGTWLGTAGAGLFHLDLAGNRFTNYQRNSTEENTLAHNFVSALLEVEPDLFWVGTRGYGIQIFDRKKNNFYPFPYKASPSNGLASKQIRTLYKDRSGDVWIGSWGEGLSRYTPRQGKLQHFPHDPADSSSLIARFVSAILHTAEGEHWVGTSAGISVLPNAEALEKKKFKHYRHNPADSTTLSHHYVRCMLQEQSGTVWIGTLGGGLNRFDRETESFTAYKHDPIDPYSISSDLVNVIFEDSQKRLWVGTQDGGLNLFNPNSHSFTHYSEEGGLPDGLVAEIQEDDRGNLWLTTKKGVSVFEPETRRIKNYDAKDGLLNYSFNTSAFIASQSGVFLAGGKKGLSVFHPDSISDNLYIPPIAISSLKKYNTKTGKIQEINIKGAPYLKEIELTYRDNILSCEFAALNFRNASKNQYAYRLEGFNEDWIDLGTKREVTFTNLDPGRYTLQLRGSNNEGVWNKEGTTLKLVVLPPWWRTRRAYLLYVLLLAAIAYTIYAFLRKRWRLQNELKKEQEEATRLKELDDFKSRLYTNLTHEFRTPLSVILGMTDQIGAKPKDHLQEGLQLIRRNGRQLLLLINQLLDLSKLENKSFQLQLQQGDIVSYLRYVAEAFQTYANTRNLSLQFFTTLESLVMDYDPKQVKQIMTNLVSNAVKFTPSGGSIKVRVSKQAQQLSIEVIDTGIGIAKKERSLVFDRFYQVDGSTTRQGEGTGIGLAHTQELVKLMGGQIFVESILGKGTTFKVLLPIRKATDTQIVEEWNNDLDEVENLFSILPPITNGAIQGDNQIVVESPQLLIIEDNPDVVAYLKTCLSDRYRLDVAYNGAVGVEKALENIPDLIVSDVMMPEKDGYEVCNTLKNDERTSHIPIILLTAKADANSRISGLKTGADAYLSKPFDKAELVVRLEMMVKKQKQLSAYFAKKFQKGLIADLPAKEETGANPIEDAFMEKARRILEQNYADEDFSLPHLCQKMRMSRSQLYRKLKALTGLSPSDFIRRYRLEKAKELLENEDLTVSEAAWRAGYKDASHFSNSFLATFGFRPGGEKNEE